jgi:23S rRNA pseudouridine2605 synthase
MKQTPKKHKPLRHGATSFTGNRRRSRDQAQKFQRRPDSAKTTDGAPNAPANDRADNARIDDARDDQRLQKILAAAGVGSRRECEELILASRVEVDGKPVTELGVRVDSRKQKITLDGEPIKFQRRTYFAVNKPTGVLSTNRDPSGRIRVVDLIGGEQRLFTVGRLDQHSDGLIIVTNDGELTQRLTHPKYGVPKTYLVQVAGEATNEVIAKLLAGVRLEEGIAKAAKASIRKQHKTHTLLEVVLTEGRNREIRRMLAQLGHKVQRLTRIAVGPIRLGKLSPGQFRPLESQEVKALKELAFQAGGFQAGGEQRSFAPRGKRPHRDKFDRKREDFRKERAPLGGEQAPSTDVRRENRPGKFGKPKFDKRSDGKRPDGKRPDGKRADGKKPYGKKPFGDRPLEGKSFGKKPFGKKPFEKKTYEKKPYEKKPFVARSTDQAATGAVGPTEERPADRRFGEKKFGARKFGAKKFDDGRPPREKKFGGTKFRDRPGARPGGRPGKSRPLNAGDRPPPAKFDRQSNQSHPLPFLKQGLVVDDDAAPATSQSRPPKPRRRKPLRRLNVRRKPAE